ncbi:uncharacterized protein LOC116246405 [Nymphaea colorata]|nr:uncharacterized protein LOC116246405 [Nymphaea colorata]
MAGSHRKISAASARAHTRKSKRGYNFRFSAGFLSKIAIVVLVGFLAWGYRAIQPPPPKICGSRDGPPITAPRIKLADGRYLAYEEFGVPKTEAKYKIIFVHGFDGCRFQTLPVSPDVLEEMGVYLVSYDRPGYGESGPDPNHSVKRKAFDIEELADQLQLGSKFYVIGFSMGGHSVWSCLKYIPHRIAGGALIAPVVNYWWPSFPTNLSREAYNKQLLQDQWALRVAHYAPWLTYWWMTQKWFPSSSVASKDPRVFTSPDMELIHKLRDLKTCSQGYSRQQGAYVSIHQDMNIGFGSWEFNPMDLDNPFPNGEASVHLWQGDDDGLVPVSLQRYVSEKLPWVHYHEIRGAGHLLIFRDGFSVEVLKVLLQGE